MFCTRVAWVCLVFLLLFKEEGSFPVSFAITKRRDMGLYEVLLSMSLLGWDGDYVSQLCVVLCWCL